MQKKPENFEDVVLEAVIYSNREYGVIANIAITDYVLRKLDKENMHDKSSRIRVTHWAKKFLLSIGYKQFVEYTGLGSNGVGVVWKWQ